MEQMSSHSGESFPLKDRFNQKAHAEIRLAKTSDADFITQLSRNVFRIYGPYEDAVSQWLESDLTMTLMALLEGKYAGFAMIGHLDDDWNLGPVSELLAIAVEPGKQRMGIGERLLVEIERKAAELKVKRLFLHTARENFSAQKLFTGMGYHPWGLKRKFYPAGQDAVLMSKEIDGEGQV